MISARPAVLLTLITCAAACDGGGTLQSRQAGSDDPSLSGQVGSGGTQSTGVGGTETPQPGEGIHPGGEGGEGVAAPGEGGSAVEPPPVPALESPAFKPAPATLHRLTVSQYRNAVTALLGPAVTVPADLEADTPLHGFSTVGAGELTISPHAAEQFETSAQVVATQAVSTPEARAALVGCDPVAVAGDPCLRSTFERLGRRAWRRPLAADELDAVGNVPAQYLRGRKLAV